MKGSKVSNENGGIHDFDENYKKLLSAKAWDMKGSKDPNENDQSDKHHDFDSNYKKTAECNGIGRESVQRLQQKWRKQQFWRKLQKNGKVQWHERPKTSTKMTKTMILINKNYKK